MSPTRADIRKWLTDMMARSGERPSQLAVRAGISASTLTRFLKSADAPMLGMRSLAKIAHAAGVPPIGLPVAGHPSPTGLSEGEASPYASYPHKTAIDSALDALIAGRNAVDPWVIHTATMSAAGLLPGDIVIVNLNAPPRAGDVVCAQKYIWQDRTAETVFRLYEPPYLLAAPADAELARKLRRPDVVDNDNVIIKGVVEAVLRIPARAT